MNRLQKPAHGLLGALSMKVGGDNPTEFGSTVVPSAELFDLYLTDWSKIETAALNIGALSTGNAAVLLVPNGKVWRFWGAGTLQFLNAADTALGVGLQVAIMQQAVFNPPVVTIAAGNLIGSAQSRGWGFWLSRPVVLTGGFGVLGTATASGVGPTVATQGSFSAFVQEFDA